MSAPTGSSALEPLSLVERVHRFANELRGRGMPVSMTERVDAMTALELTPLDDPNSLRTALATTLVKSAEHLPLFDEAFDLYFRGAVDFSHLEGIETVGGRPVVATPVADELASLDLEHAVRSVLREGSEALARLVAEQAVRRFVRFEPGRPAGGIQYEKQAADGLRLARLSREARAALDQAASASGGGGGSGDDGTAVALSLDYEKNLVYDRTELIKQEISAVIREMLVADRGVEAVVKTLRRPLPTDIVISMASTAQLNEIERVMKPLQQKLATTMMRKRRKHTGQLDVRATLRASMPTGGVPIEVVYKRPTPTKPKLYVIADVSGSVATFAAFTIVLVSAMTELFSKLRTFAFVENAVEITELMKDIDGAQAAVEAINNLEGLTFYNAHTDYGRMLKQFWEETSHELGPRSTILIFGDGRGNYRPSEEQTFVHITRRAGAVYWLNPENVTQWGDGDSLMNVYARHCTKAITCRTLGDLRRFVELLS